MHTDIDANRLYPYPWILQYASYTFRTKYTAEHTHKALSVSNGIAIATYASYLHSIQYIPIRVTSPLLSSQPLN